MEKMNCLRFCPSPSGALHFGSARTALFNFLLAKASGAKFVLRIEDTDRKRSKKEYEDNIIQGLKWLGIEWDEFYRQSERNGVYQDYADFLISIDRAYLEDGAIKFRVDKKEVKFHDLVRGEIKFNLALQEDFVLIKSDGSPGFHWANVVDDYDMGITHIIRGEDHIPNTPKQIQLYQAMGWNTPQYGHISLILGMDKSKLSKRNGAKSIEQFQHGGYLPKAVFNFLALLGWSDEEGREILTKQELIDVYHINRVSKSNSIFDPTKLEWMNKEYIKRLTPEGLSTFVPNGDPKLAELIQEKLTTLCDIQKWTTFLSEPSHQGIPPKWFHEFVKTIILESNMEFKTAVEEFIRFTGIDKGLVYSAIRYALTAEESGLPLFKVFDYLGRKEAIRRMKKWAVRLSMNI